MSATYRAGSFELAESDFDLTELLWVPAAATPLELELEEAVHFDEKEHPRWPKGTPKGGQFIRAGQSFGLKGHQYEVAHVVKGKIYAHLKGGKSAATIEVKTTELAGFDKAHPAKVQVAQGLEAPTPAAVKGGKGQESTVTAVSPYVDHASHDPSIPIPASSPVTAEEWQRFGKIDQEHYVELQERFGKWTPGDAKPLVDKAYSAYEAQTAAVVKESYHSQYGSSSGYSLSLVSSLLSKLGLGHGGQLPASAAEEREKAMMLQGEHRAAVQWDLYNRTHSPDIFAVHKTGDSPSWWSDILAGKKRVFSGLSQTFQYRVGGFGNTGVATPLAIRHILLSSDSALPVQTGYLKEYEVSVPEQMVLDKRSVVFTDSSLDADTRSWLSGSTNVPRGAYIHDIFKSHLEKGTPLPEIPAPAMIQMDGQSGKTWIDPEPEAWKDVGARAVMKTVANDLIVGDHFRQGGVSYQVQSIGAGGKIEGLEHPGTGKKTLTIQPFDEVEIAKPISVSGLSAGDYVMGLQGARYVIVSDPGDTTYGLRYVEITDSGLTGQAYQLKAGGSRQFYRLEGTYKPTPKSIEDKPPFEPQGWTAGAADQDFVSKLPEGSKFKVNGNYYEVATQLGHGKTKITDLITGKPGQINSNYQTHVLVPKHGYKPPPGTLLPGGEVVSGYTPQKGDWVAIDGEKWEVSTFQKSTKQWRLRRAGQPVKLLAEDDEAFKGAYRPSDFVIGEKQKLRDYAVGDKFHMGAGAKQKPYEVVSHGGAGKPTKVKDLTTGKESDVSRNASYSKLVPHTDDQGEPSFAKPAVFTPAAAPEPPKPVEPDEPDPHKAFSIDDFDKSEKGKNLKGMKRGAIFVTKYGQPLRLVEFQGTKNAKGQYAIAKVEYLAGSLAGKTSVIHSGKIVYPLTPKKAAAPEPQVSNFDPSQFTLGAVTKLKDMNVGSVVVIASPSALAGSHWKVDGKQGVAITATSMLTGEPGLLPPGTPAQKLIPKHEADSPVPYEQLAQGDLVQLEKLKAGDQFTYPGDPNTYAVAVPPDDTWSAQVSTVQDDGTLSAPASTVLGSGDTVTFHKKADDQTTDWWLGKGKVTETDPGSLSKPPGFEGYGSPYASGAKAKGGFSGKHDKVSEMVPGTVFRDKSGALWKVKAAGPTPIITDGKANFSVDGQLRGRVALQMGELPQGDSSPAVGQSGLDYGQASAESLMGPNVGNKALKDLPVGTVWVMPQSGDLYIIQDKNSNGIQSGKLKTGISVIADPQHVPKSVAIPPAEAQKPVWQNPAQGPAAPDEGDELAKAMHAAAAALAGNSPAAAPDPIFDAPAPAPKPGEKPLSSFAVGETLHFGVADWKVELHSENQAGFPVIHLRALNGPLEGELRVFPANLAGTPIEAPGGVALQGNPGGLLLAQMNPGDIVQLAPANGGGTWEVTELVADGVMAKNLDAGSGWADGAHLAGHWSPVSMSPGAGAEQGDQHAQADKDDALTAALLAVHGGEPEPAPVASPAAAAPDLHAGLDSTLEQIAAQYGSLAGVPYGDEFLPFKSAWGSGGAYKHPAIHTLAFGEKFTDKSGEVFRFVSLTGNNQAIIVSDSSGAAVKVPAGLRVKTKGVE